MTFINPIEILELQANPISSIDNALIKREKRKLFADIDLSENGHLNYKTQSLTKADCEKVIDELENRNSLEFYYHLANNQLLNEFLVNGRETLFDSFKQESIYNLPEFVKFISPFFAVKFDRSLLKAFVINNEGKTRAILRTKNLINTLDLSNAYKSLSNEIKHRIEEIDKITNDIKNEESVYTDDDINNVVQVVKDLLPKELLNQLPGYFQSQINKAASSINYLQLEIWNNFNNASVSLSLLEHLLELNIESVGKPTFEKNHRIIKKKHEERIEQEKNAPILKRWAALLLNLQSKIKSVESKELNANEAFQYIKASIPIIELNSLPSYANEIRTQIGYSIRSLSIACWNKQSDINASLSLIAFALEISVFAEAKLKFKQDETELMELEKKYKGILVCHFCETNPPDKSSTLSKTIYKETYRSTFPRRVQFQYLEMDIPRCKTCAEIHSKGNEKFYLVFFIFLSLGVVIGAITPDEHFIIGGIVGAVFGWIIGKIIESSQVREKGIKDASGSTLESHPLLIDRMREGWTFSKPSA